MTNNQKGMTLMEMVIVLAVAAAIILTTVVYAMPWVARERARSALYEIQSYMNLARIEAVSRNHDCRFLVDTATRTMQIYDSNGTSNTADDILLHQTTLAPVISFVRPDSGSAVTLSQIGSTSVYETIYTSHGIVSSGTGMVAIFGGDEFNRIQVHGAGGVMVEHWNGSAWIGA